MSLVSKNNHTLPWQPNAAMAILKKRATLIQNIRHFMNERGLLEVETPLLSHASVTDPYIESIPALVQHYSSQATKTFFLQTSPEYAMKRLLAAGSGAIYQITKAFRQEEIGNKHNPEFTILEWYRPNFNHHQLMDEVDALLQTILITQPAHRLTYAECFLRHLELNPHTAEVNDLKNYAIAAGLTIQDADYNKDDWLQLLMSHLIEPKLGLHSPCFIYDFPSSQAALAKIQNTNPPLAARFEVYYQGIELANGFHELTDANEQYQRFVHNNQIRKTLGLPHRDIDQLFIKALQHGLPDCSGVALGVDRLIMLALKCTSIQEVITFDIQRA